MNPRTPSGSQDVDALGRMGHAVGIQDDRPPVFVRRQVYRELRKRHVHRRTQMKALKLPRRADVDEHEILLARHQPACQLLGIDVIAAGLHVGQEVRPGRDGGGWPVGVGRKIAGMGRCRRGQDEQTGRQNEDGRAESLEERAVQIASRAAESPLDVLGSPEC